MGTTEDSGADTAARQQVDRDYEVYLHLADTDRLSSILDATSDNESSEKATKRAFAAFVYDALDGGKRDPFKTSETTEETYIVSVGSTDIEFGVSRHGSTPDLYNEMMEAAANYGGQHPLSFRVDESTNVDYKNSPSRVLYYALNPVLSVDEGYFPENYHPQNHEPFHNRDGLTWKTGDGEQWVELSLSTHRCLTMRSYIERGQTEPAIKLSVSIRAEAKAAVDLIDEMVFRDLTAAMDDLFGDAFVVETGEKTTEVCEITE